MLRDDCSGFCCFPRERYCNRALPRLSLYYSFYILLCKVFKCFLISVGCRGSPKIYQSGQNVCRPGCQLFAQSSFCFRASLSFSNYLSFPVADFFYSSANFLVLLLFVFLRSHFLEKAVETESYLFHQFIR